jgi:hypothetical protein
MAIWDPLTVNVAGCRKRADGHEFDRWEQHSRFDLAYYPKRGGGNHAVTVHFGVCRHCHEPALGLSQVRKDKPQWTATLGGTDVR